jgi:hypothetical protein
MHLCASTFPKGPFLFTCLLRVPSSWNYFTQFDSTPILHGSFTNSCAGLFMFPGRKWRWILYLQSLNPDQKGFQQLQLQFRCHNSSLTISISGAKILSYLTQTPNNQYQGKSRIKLQKGQKTDSQVKSSVTRSKSNEKH